MQLTASKYDPQNDPHMPKVGDIQKGCEFLKVEPIETSTLMKMIIKGNEPELIEGSDEVLVLNNPERPYLRYLVWVKHLTEKVVFLSRFGGQSWSEEVPDDLTKKQGITFDSNGNAANFWMVTSDVSGVKEVKEILKQKIAEYEACF
jgi:hypothetical protein